MKTQKLCSDLGTGQAKAPGNGAAVTLLWGLDLTAGPNLPYKQGRKKICSFVLLGVEFKSQLKEKKIFPKKITE